jgi:elongator complex protein 3
MHRYRRRSLSGVVPLAVMFPPTPCPGKCVFCPSETIQSYFDEDPVPSRAIRVGFDPKKQVLDRIDMLKKYGNFCNKIELVMMGGTFCAMDWELQKQFLKGCVDAMNGKDSPTLKESLDLNETAPIRCVDIGLETRPDFCPVDKLMELVVNRVELGVQSLDEEVLKTCKRGHTVQVVADTAAACKKVGIKLCYHMMIGLPGSTHESDMETFRKLFTDERFMPDMIKIYPTLVMPNSQLEKWWKQGKYEPLTTEEAVDRIVEIKKIVPKWVRIMRIQRDFQVHRIIAGPNKVDLRNMVWKKFKGCQCIRCREVRRIEQGDPKLHVETYASSGGTQYFISFTPPLIGFVRLRLDNENATISELRVYGPEAKLGEKGAWQHRGYGKKLLREAEIIAADKGYKKMRILSAIGTIGYYKKRGYHKESYWMVKDLT